MVPKSMSIWIQRAGRAGRNRQIRARAILLVQPSVFQEINTGKGAEVADEGVKYRKDVEEGLREWIETEECRRNASDVYFNDGVPRKGMSPLPEHSLSSRPSSSDPTGICCDNCLRKLNIDHPLLSKFPTTATSVSKRPISPSSDIESSPRQEPDEQGKRQMAEGARVANRRDDHLKGARDLLESWRITTWLEQYYRRPWGHQCLLSDTLITSIATKARFKSVEEFINAGWSPTHADKHGDEILAMLQEYDKGFHKKREEEKRQKADRRKQETAERRAAKREAVLEERAQKRAQPKKPRPSRAKKTPTPLITGTLTDATAFYLNGHAPPFSTPTATPLTPVPHPGHENIPPHIVSPHTPLPMNFLPHYSIVPMYMSSPSPVFPSSPFQPSTSTLPSLHYAPSPYPPPNQAFMMTAGPSQLTPAHFHAVHYPPSFLSSNNSQS